MPKELPARFQTVLPRITRHARCYFRHVRCLHRKADCVSEIVSICWKWWLRLVERGKDPSKFVSVLATFAVRAVRNGRRLCGRLRAKDAMSEVAQQRHGFVVGKLPDFSTESTNPLVEALADNTPSPDAAAFRIDWPAWLRTRTDRDRRIIHGMAMSERTLELARRYGLSSARISQLRGDFHSDWEQFTGDREERNRR